MPRVKRGVTARARHKKVLALAKGYRGRRKNVFRIAKQAVMPKMKTKSGAKKRFRVRPGGTVKRAQAFKRHILTKKSTKNKRHLRGSVAVHETNMGHIAQMLPLAGL
jgi:large subunit ribosomal protein L35